MTLAAVTIVGAGETGLRVADTLLTAGMDDFVMLAAPGGEDRWPARLSGHLRSGREVVSSVFDDAGDSWTLTTRAGESFRSRVVIAACGPIHVPWIPILPGSNDFGGVSVHSAAWRSDFDPSGKRIAVVGADAASGNLIEGLTASAASVSVFAHLPRRIVGELPSRRTRATRWLRRQLPGAPHRTAELLRSGVHTVTVSGIRTRDGHHHEADAIVYGTGFAITAGLPDDTLVGAGGLTIQQAWYDGMEPYLGVALRGFPNYFLITGADVDAQARYIVECVQHLQHSSATRIEVRRSSHHVFNERMHLRPPARPRVSSVFELSSDDDVEAEIYDGSATLMIADARQRVRVRLTGHLNAIDGRYHWRGTVFGQSLGDNLMRSPQVTLTVGGRSAVARITEQASGGTIWVTGVGAPPFVLAGANLLATAP